MKSLKNLLAPFIILIALVIGVVIYYVVNNAQNKAASETSGGAIDIVYFSSTNVSSLTVYNRDTNQNIIVNCTTNSDGTVNYQYNGDDARADENYSQLSLSYYVTAMTAFSSSLKVSSSGNYAEFGLDNPKYIITINSTTGTATTVYLGNISPDGQYCYMSVSGTNDIYALPAAKLDMAGKTALDFLESTALSIEFDELKSVHFDRTTDNLSLDVNVITTASGSTSFEIVKPYSHAVSSYFTELVSDITKLQISDYLAISKNELANYGLDKPAYHFLLTFKNGEKKELYISTKLNGYYYGYMNGMNNYFLLSEYQIDGLDLQELVLIYPYVFSCKPSDYTSIIGTYGDKSFKFELSVDEGKSVSDSSSEITLDGRNAKINDSKGRSYCSVLFESISGIKIGGIELKDNVNTAGGAVMSFSFIDKSYNTTVYEFYQRDADTYYAFKDGEYLGFYVYAKELFYNAGTDTYNYGCWSAYELLNEAISNNINGIYDIQEKTE